MTPPDGLLTRAQVLAELERLWDTVNGEHRIQGSPYHEGAADAYDVALQVFRRLAPEGVDVNALAGAIAYSWNMDDFFVWRDIDPSVSGARALILQHVRPSAGADAARRGQAIADWLHDRISLAKLAEELGVNVADVSALEAATRQPCAGCRAVLAAACLMYATRLAEHTQTLASIHGLIRSTMTPCTCGLRPRATAGA